MSNVRLFIFCKFYISICLFPWSESLGVPNAAQVRKNPERAEEVGGAEDGGIAEMGGAEVGRGAEV